MQHVPETPHVLPPGAVLQSLLQVTAFPRQSNTDVQSFAVQAGGQAQVLVGPQTSLPGQLPQLSLSPQAFVTTPHFPPASLSQRAGGGGVGHELVQSSVPPQPSEMPLHAPGLLQVKGTQPHLLVAVLQVTPPAHAGQVTETPHPVSVPHFPAQSASVGGMHAMHWCVCASQTCGARHEGQRTSTPHESRIARTAPRRRRTPGSGTRRCA